jgi:hypothetical protein
MIKGLPTRITFGIFAGSYAARNHSSGLHRHPSQPGQFEEVAPGDPLRVFANFCHLVLLSDYLTGSLNCKPCVDKTKLS